MECYYEGPKWLERNVRMSLDIRLEIQGARNVTFLKKLIFFMVTSVSKIQQVSAIHFNIKSYIYLHCVFTYHS